MKHRRKSVAADPEDLRYVTSLTQYIHSSNHSAWVWQEITCEGEVSISETEGHRWSNRECQRTRATRGPSRTVSPPLFTFQLATRHFMMLRKKEELEREVIQSAKFMDESENKEGIVSPGLRTNILIGNVLNVMQMSAQRLKIRGSLQQLKSTTWSTKSERMVWMTCMKWRPRCEDCWHPWTNKPKSLKNSARTSNIKDRLCHCLLPQNCLHACHIFFTHRLQLSLTWPPLNFQGTTHY